MGENDVERGRANAESSVVVNIVFFMQDTGAVYGAERATLDLAHGLREAGESPLFFLMREERLGAPSAFAAAIEAGGFPVRYFPVSGRFSWPLVHALREAFAGVGGEELHVLGYKAHVHALLAGIRPRVSTVHGWLFRADLKERFYGWIEMFCLRRCDRVIALSSYYEQYLLQQGIRRNRLVRIPSGLREVPASAAEVAASGPVKFGMMGRFSEEKNHVMFLRAAAKAHAANPELRYVIAGAGPLEMEIRRMVQESGLAGVVEFPGYLAVEDFFRRVDVYVICSKIENLPYSILEAMAYARPVIGTRVGGIPDLVGDGTTGRLVAPDDADHLAEAMQLIAGDRQIITAMGKAGREKLLNEFDARMCVKAHQSLYREL